MGILIQVPFLFGAYYMLRGYGGISGIPFLFIPDLSMPDAALFGINLLPLLMTGVNMLSACVAPGFGRNETARAWAIAILFLALLYNAPSALLVFWTCNNLWGLLANMRALSSMGENPIVAMRGRLAEVIGSMSRKIAAPRFKWMMFYSAMLLALQSVAAVYLNGTDKREVMISHALGFILLAASSAIFLKRGKRGMPIARAMAYAAIISPAAILWLDWVGDYLELGFSARSLFTDFRPSLVLVSESLLGRNIYIAQFLASVALAAFSPKPGVGPAAARRAPANWTMVFFATAAAASFQAVPNGDYLNIKTIWVYYGIFLAIASALFASVSFLGRGRVSDDDAAIIASTFMFALLVAPSAQNHFKMFGKTTVIFAALFVPMSVLASSSPTRAGRTVMALLVASTLLTSSIDLFHKGDGTRAKSPPPGNVFKEDSVKVDIREEERASVFFLVYDAIPDLETLAELDVDAGPLERLLRGNGFKVYDRTFTIQGDSLKSMSRTFDISDAPYLSTPQQWEMCAGNSTSFRIFSNNSYKTALIQGDYMTGGMSFTDECWPPFQDAAHSSNALSILVKGILMGEFRFDLTGIVDYSEDSYHEFLRDVMAVKEGPWVTAMHAGLPGHSQNSGKLLPNETELFVDRLNQALSHMREDIRAIRENDPSAVIVILGDHGPYLTGDGMLLADYMPEDITELMIRDRFGTLVAIRWPDPERASKYDSELLTNQDIFPVVFAYLADSDEPLQLMVKEKKAMLKGRVWLDNGTFIPAGP
jgi:hypothetical protein